MKSTTVMPSKCCGDDPFGRGRKCTLRVTIADVQDVSVDACDTFVPALESVCELLSERSLTGACNVPP
jgi:hypothetical protein